MSYETPAAALLQVPTLSGACLPWRRTRIASVPEGKCSRGQLELCEEDRRRMHSRRGLTALAFLMRVTPLPLAALADVRSLDSRAYSKDVLCPLPENAPASLEFPEKHNTTLMYSGG